MRAPPQISPTTSMLNEYRADAATSVAKDGEAPESCQEDALKEKQHQRGTACAHIALRCAWLLMILLS